MISLCRLLIPCPKVSSRSKTKTLLPCRDNSAAMARPTTPSPMRGIWLRRQLLLRLRQRLLVAVLDQQLLDFRRDHHVRPRDAARAHLERARDDDGQHRHHRYRRPSFARELHHRPHPLIQHSSHSRHQALAARAAVHRACHA
ncbi:MAG: hypothetical protein R6U37_02490, partial [Dehalococcoidia bacterium]